MAAYFGNFEQMSATFSSSEGENIALSLGRIAEKIGRKIKECEEDHKTQLFIFMDGIDSGLCLDVYTGDYKRFASYESYYKFILQSRERKDQRFV